MKNLYRILKEKLLLINSAKFIEEKRLKVLLDRMKSLIKTSVKGEIEIKEWDSFASEEQKKLWAYDTKTHTILYPVQGTFAIQKLKDEHIISTLLHEIGHGKYMGNGYSAKKAPEPSYAFVQLVNVFEDLRVENLLMMEYPGVYDSFKNFSDIMEKVISKESLKEHPAWINYLMNVLRTEWKRTFVFKNGKVEEVFKNTEKYIQEAIEMPTAEDMVDKILIPKIWPEYKKLVEKDDYKKQDGKEPLSPTPQISSVKLPLVVKLLLVVDLKITDDYKKVSDIKSILEEKAKKKLPEREKQFPLLAEARKKDKEEKENAKSTMRVQYSSKKFSYEELYSEIAYYIPYFAKKLNSIMTDNRLKRKGGLFRSGKLNNKKLYKWKCHSSKLFSKNIFRLHKDYSVSLLVDESGSMTENMMIEEAKAVVLLSEVLDFIDIPFEIVGFNATTRVYKSISQKFNWSIKRNLENIIPEARSGNSGYTNDVFAINRTAHRLKNRTGEKIILVLTDGGSAPPKKELPIKDRKGIPAIKQYMSDLKLKEEIHNARQNGSILIGIGIKTEKVQESYPQSVVIDDVTTLPKVLLNRLTKNILRG